MKIPTEGEQHWTRVQAWLFMPKAEIDIEHLFRQVGEREPAGDPWFISDADQASCRTRVTLFSFDPGAETPPAWIFLIDTSKLVGPPPSKFEQLTHEAFFSALRQSIRSGFESFIHAVTDLEFPSPPAEWRLPILAHPPKLSGVEGELGAMSLSGITLDFTGSNLGLSRATLVRSIESSKLDISLRYFMRLESSSLADLYEQILNKAEQFSALFVNPRSEAATVTA